MASSSSSYLKDYLWELARSSYRALEITDSLAILGVVSLGLWKWWQGDHEPISHLSCQYVTALLSALIVVRLFTTPYATYVQHRTEIDSLVDRLTSRLEPDSPDVATTRAGEHAAAYLRIGIRNASDAVAERCSARLQRIEHKERDGNFRDLAYTDSLDMAWSNKVGDVGHTDIQPHSTQLLDVVFGLESGRRLNLATIVKPNQYSSLLTLPGEYRFTIQANGRGIAPVNFQLRCHWGFGNVLGVPADPIAVLT